MLIDQITEPLQEIRDFKAIFTEQEKILNQLLQGKSDLEKNLLIKTADLKTISRLEKFLEIIPQGNLNQRRSFILSKIILSDKLTKERIKEAVYQITGGTSLVHLYTADEEENPIPNYCVLEITVQNPKSEGLFEDVRRSISSLLPVHVKLEIIRYFCTWRVIKEDFETWEDVRNHGTWLDIQEYARLEKIRKEFYNAKIRES